jgi:hypothetical protein
MQEEQNEQDELSQHLLACIDVEVACAELYRTLKVTHPAALELWERLQESEHHHADLLTIAYTMHLDGKFLDGARLPPMPQVEQCMQVAGEIREKAMAGSLSLSHVLDLTLELEKSIMEGYFSRLIEDDTSSILVHIRNLYADEKCHTELIREFKLKSGLF